LDVGCRGVEQNLSCGQDEREIDPGPASLRKMSNREKGALREEHPQSVGMPNPEEVLAAQQTAPANAPSRGGSQWQHCQIQSSSIRMLDELDVVVDARSGNDVGRPPES
jgi:hypothetical protein